MQKVEVSRKGVEGASFKDAPPPARAWGCAPGCTEDVFGACNGYRCGQWQAFWSTQSVMPICWDFFADLGEGLQCKPRQVKMLGYRHHRIW